MPLFDRQKSRQRRVDPRKLHGHGVRGHLIQWTQPRYVRRFLVLLLFFAGCMLLIHLPYEPLRYRIGQPVKEPIRARVDFSYEDRQATRQAREEARGKAPNIYVRDPTYTAKIREEFASLISAAKDAAARDAAPKPPPEPSADDADRPAPPPALPPAASPDAPAAEGQPLTPEQAEEARRRAAEAARRAEEDRKAAETARKAAEAAEAARKKLIEAWGLTRDFEALKRLAADPRQLDDIVRKFDEIIGYLNALPIISEGQAIREGMEPQRTHIYVLTNNILEPLPKDKLLDASKTATTNAIKKKTDEIFSGAGLPDWLPTRLADRINAGLAPNLVFNEKQTADKRDEAANAVDPVVQHFKKGTELVPADAVISQLDYEKLQVEHDEYLKQVQWYEHLLALLGSAILVGALVFLLAVYTRLFQRDVADRAIRAFVLAVMFLLVLAIAKFAYTRVQRPMVIFPLTTAAMIVAIAYNRRFALASTWVMIFLIALATRLDYDDALLLVIGTSTAVLQLDEIRNRSKLIRVSFIAGIAFFLAVWAQSMWKGEVRWSLESVSRLVEESGLAFVFGLLPGFVILGILPFIERLFNVVTSISLLELCDVNQPALRNLAIQAPGTYSHSLLLGSLVEPAAEAIGANGLLARVGAYFHDIGKANKPQYFTENRGQLANASDHSNLTPQMSKLILTGHIKDGIDMAEQYNLPKVVNRFIAEHHGSTVIQYFYNEARRAPDATVDETDFRYPGPRPQSRETAILMLADSCEGAVRSIKDQTPARIEDKVHEIVMKRLLDGQLNESGLTLNDVSAVEQSLTKSLISVYHGRIAYPAPEEKEPQPSNGRPQRPAETPPAAADTEE